MRVSRSRTRDATNLLTSTPDEFALGLACALLTARDLLSLRLVCRRFNIRCIAGGGAAAAAAEMLCIVEEAGRLWMARCSEQERGWAPRIGRKSWLGLMHEVELLRVLLVFGRAHADVTLSEGGAVATKSAYYGSIDSAASKVVMRSGCHFVQFTVLDGNNMCFGVIRPGWDVRRDLGAHNVDDHCFYHTGTGCRLPDSSWEGMQPAREQGARIGLLVDLDQGSMTVWKNDEKLGVMRAEGLRGPLCWAVCMGGHCSVRIASAVALASPTEEEPSVAKAWQHANNL